MRKHQEKASFAGIKEAAKSFAQTGDFPPNYWVMFTNEGSGTMSMTVPQAGNLWVYYDVGSAPAESIGVLHQGGTKTTIQLGENNIPVGEGDTLYYQLANPAADSIKLGLQLT